jgi:hypothetical protein
MGRVVLPRIARWYGAPTKPGAGKRHLAHSARLLE